MQSISLCGKFCCKNSNFFIERLNSIIKITQKYYARLASPLSWNRTEQRMLFHVLQPLLVRFYLKYQIFATTRLFV